jgi:hypothetical protein
MQRLRSISEQWEVLTHKTTEKSMKLKGNINSYQPEGFFITLS